METLKGFCAILLGHVIILYTDINNIKFENFTTERVLNWRLMLEEYVLEIKYIKGPDKKVADTLIMLPLIRSDIIESDVSR